MGLDDATKSWDLLVQRIEAFIDAWENSEEPPRPGDFLPGGPPPIKRMVLVELIKVDLEYRWQRQTEPKQIEQYIDDYPLLCSDGDIPCDLIYEEFHVRRQNGESIQADDFFRRFPDHADRLRGLLGIDDPLQTSAIFGGSGVDEVEAGQQLDDFDLLVMLGSGSFARVFLARQRSMQRLVAVKISADRGSEPQTLAQLDHPHIVRVYDQRRLPRQKLRLLYMQHVAGGTLQDVIHLVRQVPPHQRRGGLLLEAVDAAVANVGGEPMSDSPARRQLAGQSWASVVCRIGAQLASALDYSHQQGILHRDVKPANILITASGSPKLADFNVSFSSKLDGATPAAYFGGSLAYMSPEQLEACNSNHSRQPEQLDGRSDLYSLAVVLWELYHGERPFGDEQLVGGWTTTLEQMANRRRSDPPLASESSTEQDHYQLCQVLRRCMSSEPGDRFDSGEALAEQFQLCLRPHARWLLCGGDENWRRRTRRWALVVVLLCGLAPNALAGWFNLVYNKHAIIDPLRNSQQAFWMVQGAINGVAFPLGMCVLVWLSWSTSRALRRGCGESPESRQTDSMRTAALRLGHYAAAIGLVEWTIAGFAYPLAIYLLVDGMKVDAWFHFVASLVLCGLVAAAYPFFFISFFALRSFYPNLLPRPRVSQSDAAELSALARWANLYLLSAGSVPMLAVALLVLTGSQNKFALAVLSCVGLIGFALAFWLFRAIQRDVAALIDVAESTRRP